MAESTFISSRQNALVKELSKLSDRAVREQRGSFAAEGTTLVFEALDMGIVPRCIMIEESLMERISGRLLEYKLDGTQIFTVTREVYMKITSENAPEGIFAEIPFLDNIRNICDNNEKFPYNKSNRFIILENLQDPGNVGSVIRSAAAFGITGVIFCGSADIYNSKTVRATMGALFKTQLRIASDIDGAVSFVRGSADLVFGAALTERAKPMIKALFEAPVCVMIGNEGHGLSSKALGLCDSEIIIPMKRMESLNAAAAAAIIIYTMQS